MSFIKQERLAGRIRVILTELLHREIGDPRLQGITITEVKIDPELMFARVMVNALGEEDRREEVLAGLKSANSFLRREVARRVRVRVAPQLHFQWDEGLERSERVLRLFNNLEIPPAPPEEDEDSTGDDELD
jgi:ribosome-binding factor A